jgi:UDPglucose--hexose-1-phosphate uridylyltransferase
MMKRSEVRKDYIQDKYVIIAPHRNKRPHDTIQNVSPHPEHNIVDSVFSKTNLKKEKALLTIGSEKSWHLKVLANKYPAVSLNNPKAYGRQEVVVETPDPNIHMDQMPVVQIERILQSYAIRTTEISKNKKIEYILIFKNNGGSAGASLHHSHSQIFATDFVPPHLMDKSQKQQEYKLKTGRCVYCDVIKKEAKGPRLVYKDKHVIAFTPYASMYNYEVWIMPLAHHDNITDLNTVEMTSWAGILKHILQRIDKLNLPYNYYFHQVINDNDQHLYMKIAPRGTVWAGVEIGSGLVINPIDPDEAAKYYRQGLKK